LVTYVTDGIVSAMEQAKAAAGGRNVMVHGALAVVHASVLLPIGLPSGPPFSPWGKIAWPALAAIRKTRDPAFGELRKWNA
jgi:hypothetical protein